jgi:hypothetical protein
MLSREMDEIASTLLATPIMQKNRAERECVAQSGESSELQNIPAKQI